MIVGSRTDGVCGCGCRLSRLLEGAKSRNQVLRLHCVSYVTLTLQQWSMSHLSKYVSFL